jgi:hypothetical protein
MIDPWMNELFATREGGRHQGSASKHRFRAFTPRHREAMVSNPMDNGKVFFRQTLGVKLTGDFRDVGSNNGDELIIAVGLDIVGHIDTPDACPEYLTPQRERKIYSDISVLSRKH